MNVRVAAWVLYDWAYSAFSTIVATFVFATYFTQAVARDPASGTAQWAAGQAAAGLVIALTAVPLGAIADRGGRRRSMLAAATLVVTLATAGLWWVRPHAGDAARALLLVGTATVALEIASVLYNAMLPSLVAPERLGRLSMLGWGAGYGGGLVALTICLAAFVLPATPPFGLDRAQAEPVRACALLAAGWLALFGWPVSVWAPPEPAGARWGVALRQGVRGLRQVLSTALADRVLSRFLLARLFYMDGLTTLFAFGGIYAAGQFGLDAKGVLMFGIGLTVTAGLGVMAFAVIEDRIGARVTILICVAGLAVVGAGLLVVRDVRVFWALGLLLGVFVGPAQAASRSLMAHLAPEGDRAACFGLLALSGRVTAFAGPLALSVVTALTGSQRAGMAVIVAFLAIGGLLMARLPGRVGASTTARGVRASQRG